MGTSVIIIIVLSCALGSVLIGIFIYVGWYNCFSKSKLYEIILVSICLICFKNSAPGIELKMDVANFFGGKEKFIKLQVKLDIEYPHLDFRIYFFCSNDFYSEETIKLN